MDSNFHERYASLNDDELLHIAGDRRDLIKEAAAALDSEMAQRGLTYKQARVRKRDDLRLDIKEARAHIAKRNKSKYFVARMNLRAYLIGLAGFVLLMVLTFSYQLVPDEWSWPLFVVYISALMACLAVQSWVRRTLSFWLCLVISFVPQFIVSHWLAVYHPSHSSSGMNGSAFLSMLAGYVLGGSIFLLLQKLKPGQGPNATN